MHRDHFQELRRHVLEQRGDADLALGFQLAALHARDRGVGAQRMADDVQFGIERHLAQWF